MKYVPTLPCVNFGVTFVAFVIVASVLYIFFQSDVQSENEFLNEPIKLSPWGSSTDVFTACGEVTDDSPEWGIRTAVVRRESDGRRFRVLVPSGEDVKPDDTVEIFWVYFPQAKRWRMDALYARRKEKRDK